MTHTTAPAAARDRDRPVAVVGATGLQGGFTARALLNAGAPVRAMTRAPGAAAAQELRDLGAEVVQADLDDPASLRAAFADVAAVFAMTTPGAAQDANAEAVHGRVIADAADAAAVPHVVYSSVGGAERHTDIPHFVSKREVETYLLSLGVSATFLRPVFFMDNFAQFMTPTVEDDTLMVRMPLPGGVALQMIAAADVGAIAAAAILHPDRIPGEAVEIAGDELTGEQIAEAYSRRYDLPARYEALPVSVLADNADQQAMFSWFARLPAYQADFATTRALAPDTLTFDRWLDSQPAL